MPSLVGIGPAVLENFVNVFSLFLNYSPWKLGGVLFMNKFEFP